MVHLLDVETAKIIIFNNMSKSVEECLKAGYNKYLIKNFKQSTF